MTCSPATSHPSSNLTQRITRPAIIPEASKGSSEANISSLNGEFEQDEYELIDCHRQYLDVQSYNFYDLVDLDQSLYEYEQGAPSVIVKGRLKTHVQFWEDIGSPDFIIDTIKNGYTIPFLSTPTSVYLRNNKSALKYGDFVSEALSELLQSRCILEVPFIPKVTNPLSVSIGKSGKKRLILDLRHVNFHVLKQKVKFEDWKVALDYMKKGNFMYNFDLKSGYHHVDIAPVCQTFLGFSWVYQGKLRHFVFTVLPFGLSSAPYIFTKLLRPLVGHWRGKGIPILVYLDDGLGSNSELSDCSNQALTVKQDLKCSGLVINLTKSQFDPVQIIEWLGIIWNMVAGEILIPERRILDLEVTLSQTFGQLPFTTARKLARLTGKIISMSPVIGNISRLMTRNLYAIIISRKNWDFNINIKDAVETIAEMFFWKNNIRMLNRRRLVEQDLPQKLVYSDASNVALGAYVVHTDNAVAHKMWSGSEATKSSTWREIKAVSVGLSAFGEILKNKVVKWHSDSQAAIKIISVGSQVQVLQEIAMDIFSTCLKYSIKLIPEWVPRSDNQTADELSRIIDYDDWGTTSEFFIFMNQLWGPYTVDRFANYENTKLPRFYSRFWSPGCENVDGLSQNWEMENNWLVPPVYLCPKVIVHAIKCKAVATLIVPKWKSAAFWPCIFDGCNWKWFVQDVIEFDSRGVYQLGSNPNGLFGSDRFHSKVLAVRINASYE